MEIVTSGGVRNENSFHQGNCTICGVIGNVSERSQREIRRFVDIKVKKHKTEKRHRLTREEIKIISSKRSLPRDNTGEEIVPGLNITIHQ